MSVVTKFAAPSYEITIRDAIFAFIEKMDQGTPVYERDGSTENTLVRQMSIIKKLNVQPDVSSKKIHASGVVYDVTNNTKGAKAGLGAVAFPRDVRDKALGSSVKGGISYDKINDTGKEFSFGYWCEQSDGTQVYYFHPRCKLVPGDQNHETSSDSDRDPEDNYDIEIMPTNEGIWRVRYYTKDHAENKKPLTVQQFFEALPYKAATIEGLLELEASV